MPHPDTELLFFILLLLVRWNKSFLSNMSQIRNKTPSLNLFYSQSQGYLGLFLIILNVLLQPLLYFNVLEAGK